MGNWKATSCWLWKTLKQSAGWVCSACSSPLTSGRIWLLGEDWCQSKGFAVPILHATRKEWYLIHMLQIWSLWMPDPFWRCGKLVEGKPVKSTSVVWWICFLLLVLLPIVPMSNERFNNIIWSKAPKNEHYSLATIETAVSPPLSSSTVKQWPRKLFWKPWGWRLVHFAWLPCLPATRFVFISLSGRMNRWQRRGRRGSDRRRWVWKRHA